MVKGIIHDDDGGRVVCGAHERKRNRGPYACNERNEDGIHNPPMKRTKATKLRRPLIYGCYWSVTEETEAVAAVKRMRMVQSGAAREGV